MHHYASDRGGRGVVARDSNCAARAAARAHAAGTARIAVAASSRASVAHWRCVRGNATGSRSKRCVGRGRRARRAASGGFGGRQRPPRCAVHARLAPHPAAPELTAACALPEPRLDLAPGYVFAGWYKVGERLGDQCQRARTRLPQLKNRPELLLLDDEIVGYRVRTRADARAVVAHAAWRTDAETACELALRAGGNSRTPEPLRQSRQLARQARTDANPSP